MYRQDTIAAVATPSGPGAIGVIRVSGPECERIAAAVFARDAKHSWRSRVLYRGRILRDGAALDDALAVLMRAPNSYTGEDVLELHCHGSPAVLATALQAVLRAGARPAEAGEFTKRAFLNGKLDLTQAEAVIDLIRARTPEGVEQAADQLFGRLASHLGELRTQLIRIKGHLEARIDFSDEEIDFDDEELSAEIEVSLATVRDLLRTYARGRLVKQGLRLAITGRPNVGKSSLLNALAQADRAIVTALPGTTRDVIEEGLDFDGVPVIVADTAGLRDAADEIERIGVERARAVAAAADVVLVILDRSMPYEAPAHVPREGQRCVFVLNKVDRPAAWGRDRLDDRSHPVVEVSALTGAGLEALRHAVVEAAGFVHGDSLPTLTSERQRDALAAVEDDLMRALTATRADTPPDLVAVDVQLALEHVGSVTGECSNEDVLDAIFREFCIGK
jgi:tRNA modification GTPase